jgi:hypothetical protein
MRSVIIINIDHTSRRSCGDTPGDTRNSVREFSIPQRKERLRRQRAAVSPRIAISVTAKKVKVGKKTPAALLHRSHSTFEVLPWEAYLERPRTFARRLKVDQAVYQWRENP